MKRSFTLIELLIVLVIIGIVTTLAVPQYQKYVEKARSAEAMDFFIAIRKTQETYFLETGEYAEDLWQLMDVGLKGTDRRSTYYDYGLTKKIGYDGNTRQNGGPADYNGYTISAWRLKPDVTLGPPQYHMHEKGPVAETQLPAESTQEVTHSHDGYTHTHMMPVT